VSECKAEKKMQNIHRRVWLSNVKEVCQWRVERIERIRVYDCDECVRVREMRG
jgi:ribosomal protein L28